jgi:protein-L-isoaspartate(D-aspartate) O-methyltransferase
MRAAIPMPPTTSLAPWLALALPAAAACGCVARSAADPYAEARERMVAEQLVARGVTDAKVLEAMRAVPRHRFVPPEWRELAHRDHPLPIGFDQTISQPFVVAFMTAALSLRGGERVLEVGTGSGYQAAVLGEIAREVWTIEIVEPLARQAESVLEELGYDNVHVRAGDGYRGWPEAAPFDAIIVTAAPEEVPQPLLDQLAPNGRLVAPVGGDDQELVLISRGPGGLERKTLLPVRFVPMTGEAQRRAGAPPGDAPAPPSRR